jgi:hypothetical protein
VEAAEGAACFSEQPAAMAGQVGSAPGEGPAGPSQSGELDLAAWARQFVQAQSGIADMQVG